MYEMLGSSGTNIFALHKSHILKPVGRNLHFLQLLQAAQPAAVSRAVVSAVVLACHGWFFQRQLCLAMAVAAFASCRRQAAVVCSEAFGGGCLPYFGSSHFRFVVGAAG
ncbi:unnamed protein product [Lathyrus oleraceus]